MLLATVGLNALLPYSLTNYLQVFVLINLLTYVVITAVLHSRPTSVSDHRWSSGCRLSVTELFRLPPPPVSGTNYHATSHLHCPC